MSFVKLHLVLKTDRRTDGPTDGPTDIATYRAAIAAKNIVNFFANIDILELSKYYCTMNLIILSNYSIQLYHS